MKKIKSIAFVLMSACMLFTGCGKLVDEVPTNKTVVYVSVYNGGTGVSWIENLAQTWSDSNEDYLVKIVAEKASDIVAKIDAGETANSASAYFMAGLDTSTIYGGKLEDLSDVLAKKVDGESGGTIGDKLGRQAGYAEMWKSASSRFGEGCYMLPYADSLAGWVYDHDLFLEKGWLNYASVSAMADVVADGVACSVSGDYLVASGNTGYYSTGDKILTKGKDGKFGTYDDGQPVTEAEFANLINTIVRVDGKKAFLWTSLNNEYLDSMAYALTAQYGGMAEWNAFAAKTSGSVQVPLRTAGTGAINSQTISIEEGYKFYEMQSMYKAFEFMGTHLLNSDNLNPLCSSFSTTHSEAQNSYLLGYREESGTPLTAMIFEGVWWENEASAMFATIEKRDADRGLGKRDYRYMLYPNLDGQKGVDGEGNGTVFSCLDSGGIIVPKSANTAKVNAVKDFIAYTLTNENLRYFTKETGVIRAYKYDLTEADKQEMTPFARCVWDIYSDDKNISIIRPIVVNSALPLVSLGGYKAPGNFTSTVGVQTYSTAIKAMQQAKSAVGAFEGMQEYYSKATNKAAWLLALDTAKQYGFYA